MNKKEFIAGLKEVTKERVLGFLDEVSISLDNLQRLSDDIVYMHEHDLPFYDFISEDFQQQIDSCFYGSGKVVNALESYSVVMHNARETLQGIESLKSIDIQKIPIKFRNSSSEWQSATLQDISSIGTYSGYFDFYFDTHSSEICSASIKDRNFSFDTQDSKITSLLNQAGFFTTDQIEKIESFEKNIKSALQDFQTPRIQNSVMYDFMPILACDDPKSILGLECSAFLNAKLVFDFAISKNYAVFTKKDFLNDLYERVNDILPVSIEKNAFKSMCKNNFMEPIKFVDASNSDMPLPDYVTKRVLVGDVMIDFMELFPGSNKLSAQLYVPANKMSLAEANVLNKKAFLSLDFNQKYYEKSLEYEISDALGNNAEYSSLLNSNSNSFIREFLSSYSMRMLFSQIPSRLVVKDSYINASQKNMKKDSSQQIS